MRTIKEETNIVYPENSQFRLTYQYDRIEQYWKFTGYYCSSCEKTLKFTNSMLKHAGNCYKDPNRRRYGVDPDPETVVDKFGREWRPYESNQNLSVSQDNGFSVD